MAVKTILIIADNPSERRYLEQIVDEAGYLAHGIDYGSDTVPAVAARHPDLLLLDVVGDDMNGFKICRELSRDPRTHHIPVIVVSDGQQQVDSLWAEQQGANGMVSKPFSPEQVLAQIRLLG